jgi:endogenous inhibitor of DNA gyrase (YacG/DUF329 family)
MQDRDQTDREQPPQCLRFTCPACKRRVCVPQEDRARLPRFFPFCSERCKLIDLGAWLDADYRIVNRPDEEPQDPPGPNA